MSWAFLPPPVSPISAWSLMSQSQSPTRSKAQALRRMRPTTANGPRYGVVGSILFHGLIVAAALVSFSRNLTTPEDTHVVPVDLVTIADKTIVQALAASPHPEPVMLDFPVP